MRNYLELKLINVFKRILEKNHIVDKSKPNNFGRNSKEFADVEFLNVEGEYFVIEAKSHHSKDAHNSYHKLFGELLRETRKNNTVRCTYFNKLSLAILIHIDSPNYKGVPKDRGIDFYRRQFNEIPVEKYEAFGNLLKSDYVFTCSEESNYIQQYTWLRFFNNEKLITIWN